MLLIDRRLFPDASRTSPVQIRLPDDNLKAMTIVCKIVHHKHDSSDLTYDLELFDSSTWP